MVVVLNRKLRIFVSGLLLAVFLFFGLPAKTEAAVYYISPAGSDTNDGLSQSTPFNTFVKSFTMMRGGDELILLDGMYGAEQGTGYISYLGSNSAQIPSGLSRSQMTYVHALRPGNVKVMGSLFMGRSFRKDSYIKVEGVTFEGGGNLYNTSYVVIKNSGFHSTNKSGGSVFAIGTNDGAWGNSYNLIEDVWIWGQERIIAINYRSDHNVWRRVVVRGDGCNSTDCTGSGNPNVGITVYDSSYISLENIIVVDRILGGGSPYSDFAVAQHTPGFPYGNNEWLGTISLKSPDTGYYFEPDEASLSPAHTLRNCVAWDAPVGMNFSRSGDNDIQNCTVKVTTAGSSNGIRIAPGLSGSASVVKNIIVIGTGLWGVNSSIPTSYVNLFGTWSDKPYNQTTCAIGCRTSNPQTDGSLIYLTRIESGSPLKGSGSGGADYGANVVYQYGTTGTIWGDPGYNSLTSNKLWPFPNEERIKKEMCTDISVTRGFCSASSLTQYIWETAGNSMSADLYSGSVSPLLSVIDTTTPTPTHTPSTVSRTINLAFTASASSVTPNSIISLSWTLANPAHCVGSGDWIWSGQENITSNNYVLPPLQKTSIFTLTCTNGLETISKSVTVNVVDTAVTVEVPATTTTHLSVAQVQAILDLLMSFNADAAVLANIRSLLVGGVSSSPAVSPASYPAKHIFTVDLRLGMKSEEVKELQRFLNKNGFPVTTTGVGSFGKETTYFGPATHAALVRYQESNGITPANGYLGPVTRVRMAN